ncbi:hypothetical protein V5E97_35750 [Singulisphaera sp. Ch08]|uniref:Uncharacterized protein n=1 Tax=Singulisphaera sp. Ch08 TaxID=3120278 RepID=A0AAU7CDN3_9BACT
MQLVITTTGEVRCLYSELIDLMSLGPPTITRASYVEPGPDGRWHTDLRPLLGPVLGPFERRSEALNAEQVWIEAYLLGSGS